MSILFCRIRRNAKTGGDVLAGSSARPSARKGSDRSPRWFKVYYLATCTTSLPSVDIHHGGYDTRSCNIIKRSVNANTGTVSSTSDSAIKWALVDVCLHLHSRRRCDLHAWYIPESVGLSSIGLRSITHVNEKYRILDLYIRGTDRSCTIDRITNRHHD